MSSVRGLEDLPDSLVLKIFQYVEAEDAARLNRVSKRLYSVLSDNLLWKHYFVRKWVWKQELSLDSQKAGRLRYGNPQSLAQLKKVVQVKDCRAWKSEYVRLMDRVPKHKVQVLKGHKDEVLHLAFSRDGQDLASCSKDHFLRIWRKKSPQSDEFVEAQCLDMSLYDWFNTWAVYFSRDDSKLLIGGVLDTVHGEVAIFQRGETYRFLCKSVNDPFDVMGAWFSNNYFVTGWLSSTDANCAMVWLCGIEHDPGGEGSRNLDEEPDQPASSLYKRLLFTFNRTCFLRYLKVFSRPKKLGMPPSHGVQDVISADRLFPVSTSEREDGHLASLVSGESDMVVAFLCSSDITFIPHQLAFQNVTQSVLDKTRTVDISDGHVLIEMKGHIVGMHVGPKEKYLYVNVRSWPENCQPTLFDDPPPIAREVEVRVVDLHSFQVMRNVVYAGHIGLTLSSGAFYLYLNASDDYLCSGSEDGSKGGCIWDREYGSLVSYLPHEKCVNCVAFHPNQDEMCCVTASDDHTIGIWLSSAALRKKKERKSLEIANAET